MTIRPSSDHDRARLKAATGQAIDRAGRATSFAMQTRVEPPALSKYRATHEETHFMPLDIALDCDRAAGAPVILTALASLEGYAVTPLRGGEQPISTQMVGSLIRETGDVSAAVLEAMADGGFSDNERNAIAKEIDEALAALWQLRAAVRGE